MKLARFAVSQPVLMNLMAATMVIYGALVMQDMVRESHPVVPTGWCRIATVVPGASAEEVEQLVTAPLERAVGGVDTIEQMFSTSREGLSTIFIQFDPDIEDVGREVIEISNLAGRVELPSVAEDTDVAEFKISIPTMAVAIRGTASEAVMREVGLDVAETVESIDGIAGTGRFGIRDREIRVEVSADRSAGYGVPITAVADALASRAFNIPAGTIESPGDIRLIRGMTRAADAETIRSVVVRPDPTGGAVHVGDVADVYDGFAEARIAGRVNGEEGMVLILRKSEGADSIAISAAVREAVDRMRENLPAGVSIDIFGDASHEVNRSLGALYDNAAMGLVLVLGLLWFFVGGRNATMAALGLPVALAGAIAAMAMMGITINMISLLALILCLGVVVDDAIIIIENIYRHMEEGMPRKQAAIVGMSEVFWPVVSSTLTTCAAFLPMLLMTGVLGKFFSIIPKVVIVSLAASLIEAMLVLPSHMADFGKVTKRKKADGGDAHLDADADADAVASTRARPETRWERIGRRTMATYERFLRGSLRRRWAVILVAYGVTGGLVYLTATQKDVVLFTDGDVDMFDVRIEMPTEATRDQTSAVVNEVERRILALDNDDVEATVGVRGLTRNNMGVLHGDNMGMVTVYVVPGETRSSLHAGRDLLSACNSLFDDIVGPSSIEIIEHRPGPPRGDPVAVRVFGEDLERLVELNEAIQVELQRIPGVTTIRDNFELGRREVQVFVDEERAAMHGLTPPMVTAWLARAFGSTPAATTREGRDEIDVVVRLNEESRSDPARVEMLSVPTPDGSQVSLREIADVRDGRGPQMIQRRDERRMVATYAQIDEAVTNSQAVNRELQGRIASLIAANPDVEFAYGGQYEETNKSLNSLKQSFVLALLLIYTILATQFRSFGQPFVVMAAIPLSFIGVTIGFLVTNTPVGLIALIGVVGLAGIVVNDSLVLVDFINQRRRQGVALGEAVVAASKLRLRPIFLTSITTVAGLLPLAVSGAEAPMLSPMASAMAWGLSFATFLTLVLIPCLYMGYADIARFMSRVFGPLARWVTDPGDATPEPQPEVPASAE